MYQATSVRVSLFMGLAMLPMALATLPLLIPALLIVKVADAINKSG